MQMFKRRYYNQRYRYSKEPLKIIPAIVELQFFPETFSVSVVREPTKDDGYPKIMYQNHILKVLIDGNIIEHQETEWQEGEVVSYYKFTKPITFYLFVDKDNRQNPSVFTNNKNFKV
jgi:hypothetical protein